MRLRDLSPTQKLVLNFLYEMRNTPMTPPDPRISNVGIAQALGMSTRKLSLELAALKRKGFVLPFWIDKSEYHKITLAGIHEVQKCMVTTIEGEMSTSKIGIRSAKKEVR